MKKFLSLVLALSMVLALVACGSKNNTPAPDSTTNEPTTENQDTTTPEPAEKRPNRLIIGSTTGVSGDIGPGAYWTNNADDAMVRKLINDYGTVVYGKNSDLVINEAVCAGIDSVQNEDGTKTFTVKIKEGLKYNNGDPITAADYLAGNLVMLSPAAKSVAAKVSPDTLMGAEAYQNGEVNYISGLHLVDEYTYSITINADYVPYFYELSYASLSPMHMPSYIGEGATIKDDGDGAYIDGAELDGKKIDDMRWVYDSPVTAGPYTLKSLDTASYEAVLEINPNYAGNFEGQKPSIQQLVCVKTTKETEFDALATGSVDLLNQLTDGEEINTALDMVDKGGFAASSFERNGYGKLMFQCDFGPTQFQAVRQAVAYLLDRNEFANTFCAGYGSVVHGPYGVSSWMFKESEEKFATSLNTYEYNPSKAVELLEADGWVLNADGTPYSGTGTRYKEVTPEQAGEYELNVTLADGRILMPLHIKWSSSEGNPVSELLAVMLANGTQTAEAGMVIEQAVMTFDELLNYMYRDKTQGDQYGVPTYGMYNLATGFYPIYDQSYSWSLDPEYLALGYNVNFLLDERMDQLTMDMVYEAGPDEPEKYLDLWQQYIELWNELLPEVPLYSNIYYTVYADWLENWVQTPDWGVEYAVLYATIANAE